MQKHRVGERGFALILAILALMLLTFLGLTLSAITSTELQIATNYRWSQQALYNAEAGIEAGKIVLRAIPDDWKVVLPDRRVTSWVADGAPRCPGANCTVNGQSPPATLRNWELGLDCDSWGGVGYGAILDDHFVAAPLNGSQPKQGPYQDVANFRGHPLSGAFTLWVRRDVLLSGNLAQPYEDDRDDATLVLTAEGSAPRVTAGDATSLARRAVRVLQVKLTRNDSVRGACDSAEGQVGGTASGANFGACAPLGAGGLEALAAGGGSLAPLP